MMSKNGVPCHHCRGTGQEPTALEMFDELASTLRALMWPDERIEELKDEIRADEVLIMIRWGGVDLRSPEGTVRTLDRFKRSQLKGFGTLGA
jgi:hypothetical protein